MFEKYSYENKTYWKHKTPLKCIINPILRKLQFFTDSPFVISSECEFRKDQDPKFIRYRFQRVAYRRLGYSSPFSFRSFLAASS